MGRRRGRRDREGREEHGQQKREAQDQKARDVAGTYTRKKMNICIRKSRKVPRRRNSYFASQGKERNSERCEVNWRYSIERETGERSNANKRKNKKIVGENEVEERKNDRK